MTDESVSSATAPTAPDAAPVLEAEPAAASALFGDRIETARSFTNELARRGEELGLIGPLELPRLWTRHILNSALLAPLLEARGRVADVGSGAGLPGLVLAIARPDVHFTLIEPMERRVDWLTNEASRLGLSNVTVVRGRAEDVSDDIVVDQVTARAVSALSKLIPMTVPLVRSGGQLILMKGARVDDEIEKARKVILRQHLSDVEVLELGDGVVAETTRVFRATVD
ncbi:16S rRNA m(7)G-527 methyltransferase [Curtobacterium sp. PhB42]|uniref:16S rRNA (guanine(527)-N(7))-methyltransferase RsmG n=1 Tax=unclassified Curtobacterium TaxID=257496 RepID=UPI001049A252|nr:MULTISPECIES: 16S rRNA (guanine(527)-N(7))-methyltransferase RsmG [unclassified Curtobacterium]TCU50052.1 16S rRNA m(7)G-527 methyltransferase [Curtobacterium sp. PhB146]TCU87693.1 16S rRNA m(7)G-527 methyltransferase [Curtobacterium sp. PhB191]TDW46214.1 16S rRNA m(7)G-527 methyltransferase [Curtobacterium sp. PhB42]TDW55620.1 16S rRNA m(7)G-527 methyltransferase [Curtobacterium sp. PhB190]